MQKSIKIMHFVSGIGNDGVAQYLINYTSKLNKYYPVQESIVYQHKAYPAKLKLEQDIGNKTYNIPIKLYHPMKNLYSTYKLIKKEKPDIVEAHMNLSNFFALFIAWICRVPVRISHSHIAQDADNINPKLAPLFKQLNIKFSTNLVACGNAAGKYMYGNRKFHIVYNAIEPEKYRFNSKNREEIRKKFNISKDTVVFGNIGRIVEQKNQKFLVDIFLDYLKINDDAVLFIIGDGDLDENLKEYILKKKVKNKVIRINRTKSTEKFYSAFDAFLLPSLYEGLPVVAIEAQYNGVPTLLSNNIDTSVTLSNVTKFISVNNGTHPWLDQLKKIKAQREEKNIINDNYDIYKQYPKLMNYYQEILKKENK